MAVLYVDQDGGGSATSPYDTWAKAAPDVGQALQDTACVYGSVVYVQGAANYAPGVSEDLWNTASSTDVGAALILVQGCIDGTTNEPPVKADYSTVAGADFPVIYENTVSAEYFRTRSPIHFRGVGFGSSFAGTTTMMRAYLSHTTVIEDCHSFLTGANSTYTVFLQGAQGNKYYIRKCDIECGYIYGSGAEVFSENTIWRTTRDGQIFRSDGGSIWQFLNDDFSDCAASPQPLCSGGSNLGIVILRNCKLPATYSLTGTAFTTMSASIECIGCSANTAAKTDTDSYQDYEFENQYGTVDVVTTPVRTGGADDGASGQFSFALVNFASAATAGQLNGAVSTPWMSVWVEGGVSQTLTVYATNDGTNSADLDDIEMWCDFYYPDSADTAQHTAIYDPPYNDRADITVSAQSNDDTGSTWTTGSDTYKQKFTTGAITPGFTGFAFARVTVAQDHATPDTVYVDPQIEVV